MREVPTLSHWQQAQAPPLPEVTTSVLRGAGRPPTWAHFSVISAIRLTAVGMPQGYDLVLSGICPLLQTCPLGWSVVQVGVNFLATLRISLCKCL